MKPPSDRPQETWLARRISPSSRQFTMSSVEKTWYRSIKSQPRAGPCRAMDKHKAVRLPKREPRGQPCKYW
jgi:hypothetical protein